MYGAETKVERPVSGLGRFARACLVAGALAAVFAITPPRQASAQLGVTYENFCLAAGSGCTANEVQIASVTVNDVTNTCLQAPFGTVTANFKLLVETNADRYDISVYISKTGDPVEGNNACHHEILHPISSGSPNPRNPLGTGPFRDLDQGGDICGDIRNETEPPTTDAIFLTEYVTIDCTDTPNPDGLIDFETATAWFQSGQNVLCSSVADSRGNTGSKCKLFQVTDPTFVMPARIDVTKSTLSTTLVSNNGGGSYTFDSVFQIKVQNTGLNDLINVDVIDNLETTFGCTTCFNVTNKQIVASSLTYGGSVTLNAGYTGHPGNTNLLSGATRRLDYDDVLPSSDQGDFVTFNVTVRWTKTCPFSGTNRVDATGSPRLGGAANVTDFATVNLGCTPTAVNLKGLGADSGPSGDLLAALLATLGLSGAAMLVTRRRDPFTAR